MQDLKPLCYKTHSDVMQLVTAFEQLRKDYDKIKESNKALKDKISQLENKIKIQEEELIRFKLVGTLQSKEASTKVKLKINELVREIDTCIQLIKE